MSSFEKSVSDFSEFTYQQKKDKVVSMLEVLREEGNIFDDIWQLINHIWNISEEILDIIHKIIVRAVYNLHEIELKKWVEHLENMKTNLENIKQKEKSEKEKEEAESLLEDI